MKTPRGKEVQFQWLGQHRARLTCGERRVFLAKVGDKTQLEIPDQKARWYIHWDDAKAQALAYLDREGA